MFECNDDGHRFAPMKTYDAEHDDQRQVAEVGGSQKK